MEDNTMGRGKWEEGGRVEKRKREGRQKSEEEQVWKKNAVRAEGDNVGQVELRA